MTLAREIKAVFFDFGGTLAEEAVARDAWIWARLRDRGVERELEAVQKALAVARTWHKDHQPRYGAGVDDQHRYWTWWYEGLLRQLGVGGDRCPLAEWLWETQTVPHRLYLDTRLALETMRGRGWRLGVISNWDNLELEQVLGDLEVGEFFEVVLPSALAGYAKPRPEIFERALQMIGAQPTEAAHVGDSYNADVRGARGVGMQGVLIARGYTPEGVDGPVVGSLVEVPGVLEGGAGD